VTHSAVNISLPILFSDITCLKLTGDRTFGVVTKLDLMDKGTNAVDVWKISVVQLFCAEPQGQLVTSLQIFSPCNIRF
jgi:hypothetical protein